MPPNADNEIDEASDQNAYAGKRVNGKTQVLWNQMLIDAYNFELERSHLGCKFVKGACMNVPFFFIWEINCYG